MYVDGNHAWRILSINSGIREELDFPIFTLSKLEEDLFLTNFSEVKFVSIEGLEDLIDTEFSWPLLQVTALIQLSNKTIATRYHLKEHHQRLGRNLISNYVNTTILL